jgi:hypothetical protein
MIDNFIYKHHAIYIIPVYSQIINDRTWNKELIYFINRHSLLLFYLIRFGLNKTGLDNIFTKYKIIPRNSVKLYDIAVRISIFHVNEKVVVGFLKRITFCHKYHEGPSNLLNKNGPFSLPHFSILLESNGGMAINSHNVL